jgi:hypothetical protein
MASSCLPPRPINAYVIEHSQGLILFDTGQDRASVVNDTYFHGGLSGLTAVSRTSAEPTTPVVTSVTT